MVEPGQAAVVVAARIGCQLPASWYMFWVHLVSVQTPLAPPAPNSVVT